MDFLVFLGGCLANVQLGGRPGDLEELHDARKGLRGRWGVSSRPHRVWSSRRTRRSSGLFVLIMEFLTMSSIDAETTKKWNWFRSWDSFSKSRDRVSGNSDSFRVSKLVTSAKTAAECTSLTMSGRISAISKKSMFFSASSLLTARWIHSCELAFLAIFILENSTKF